MHKQYKLRNTTNQLIYNYATNTSLTYENRLYSLVFNTYPNIIKFKRARVILYNLRYIQIIETW